MPPKEIALTAPRDQERLLPWGHKEIVSINSKVIVVSQRNA